jgi:hypothetical protein
VLSNHLVDGWTDFCFGFGSRVGQSIQLGLESGRCMMVLLSLGKSSRIGSSRVLDLLYSSSFLASIVEQSTSGVFGIILNARHHVDRSCPDAQSFRVQRNSQGEWCVSRVVCDEFGQGRCSLRQERRASAAIALSRTSVRGVR